MVEPHVLHFILYSPESLSHIQHHQTYARVGYRHPNQNVSLDVSKIGRRRGNEILKRGKIAIENNILEVSYYRKFSVLTSRTHAKWISSSIQRLQESNNKGGNNLQWLLEQQAPEDFR